MPVRLAGCRGAVVAGRAGTRHDARVIEARRGPCRGAVAAVAGGRCEYMAARLASRYRSVVATLARAGGNTRMTI
jgi:hypothetical protein